MATQSEIEWTDMTWNPVTGCTKISQGCKHCYAERMSKRLKAMGVARYSEGFKVTLHHDLIDLPKKWRTPKRVFVNSMSDLFQEHVPLDFIKEIFSVMNECPQHSFQILTKRSGRLAQLSKSLNFSPNVWMGVSVESDNHLKRIADLRSVPAHIRFLSCEPLISPLNSLDLEGIHWVIVGGESGPGARPMLKEWVTSIRDQCTNAGVPFFFKQWGGVWKKRTGRKLDGKLWDQYPARLNSL